MDALQQEEEQIDSSAKEPEKPKTVYVPPVSQDDETDLVFIDPEAEKRQMNEKKFLEDQKNRQLLLKGDGLTSTNAAI